MQHIGLALILIILQATGCTPKALELEIRFDRLEGLTAADTLIFEGNCIGKITRVYYSAQEDYRVQVRIEPDFRNAATDQARFFIVADPRQPQRKALEMIRTQAGGQLLADGTLVEGSVRPDRNLGVLWKDIEKGLSGLPDQAQELARRWRDIAQSEEALRLEAEIKRLIQAIQKSDQTVREKLRQEILPFVQQELQRLREELQDLKPAEKSAPE